MSAREEELAAAVAELGALPVPVGPSVEASADKLTQTFAPVASLREVPDGEHYPAVHHSYRVGRDLPETGGDQC